jgi:hypothetical protein
MKVTAAAAIATAAIAATVASAIAAVETTAAIIPGAAIYAAAVDASAIKAGAVDTAPVIAAAAVIAAAIIGVAAITIAIAVPDSGVDVATRVLTTRKSHCEPPDDRAQKNSTANHAASPCFDDCGSRPAATEVKPFGPRGRLY